MIPEQFKIRPGGFDEIKRRLVIKAIPTVILALTGGFVIAYFNSADHQYDLFAFAFAIPIALGAGAFGIYLGLKRQKALFDSYTLSFKNGVITREQANTATITIAYADISEIVKPASGGFVIKGGSAFNSILVSPQIDNYDRLEQLLNCIKPIAVKTNKTWSEKYRIPFLVIVIGLYMGVYLFSNKVLVAVCGALTISILTYSVYEIRTNKNIDNTTKRSMWLIAFVAVSIISALYYKLSQ